MMFQGDSDSSDNVLQLEYMYRGDVESLSYLYHSEIEIVSSYRQYRCHERVQAARLIIGAGMSLEQTRISGKTNMIAFLTLLALIEEPPVKMTHVRNGKEKYLTIEVLDRALTMRYLSAFVYVQWDGPPPKETAETSRITPPDNSWWWSWARLINRMKAFTLVSDDDGTTFRPMNVDEGLKARAIPSLMKITITEDEYLVNLDDHCKVMLRCMPNPQTMSPHLSALRLLFVDEQSRLFIHRRLDDPEPSKKLYKAIRMDNHIIRKRTSDPYGVVHVEPRGQRGRRRQRNTYVMICVSAPHHIDLLDDEVPTMAKVIIPLFHVFTDYTGVVHKTRVNAHGRVVEIDEEQCVMSAGLKGEYGGRLVSTSFSTDVELIVDDPTFLDRQALSNECLRVLFKRLRVETESIGGGEAVAGGFVPLKATVARQLFQKTVGRFYKVTIVAPDHYQLVQAGVTQFSSMEIQLYDRQLRSGERRLRKPFSVPVIIHEFGTARCVLMFAAPETDCTSEEHPVSVVDPDNRLVNLVVRKSLDPMKNVRRVLSDMMHGAVEVPPAVGTLLEAVKATRWSAVKNLSESEMNEVGDHVENCCDRYRTLKTPISFGKFLNANLPYRVLIGPPSSGKTTTIVKIALGKVKDRKKKWKAFLVAPNVVSEQHLLDMVAGKEGVLHVVTSPESKTHSSTTKLHLRQMFSGEECDVDFNKVDHSIYETCDAANIIVGTNQSILTLLRVWKPNNVKSIVCMDDCSGVQTGIACCLLALGQFTTIVLAGDPRLLGPKNYHGVSLVPDSILDIAIGIWPTAKLTSQHRSPPHVSKVWKTFYDLDFSDSSTRRGSDVRVSNAVKSLVPGAVGDELVVPLIKCRYLESSTSFGNVRDLLIPELSSCNYGEAEAVVCLLKKLLEKGVEHREIVIVTNYAGQKILIDALLRKHQLFPREQKRTRRRGRGRRDVERGTETGGISVLCADGMDGRRRRRPLTIFSPGHTHANRFVTMSRMASALVRATDELIIVLDEAVYIDLTDNESVPWWNGLRESVHVVHWDTVHKDTVHMDTVRRDVHNDTVGQKG